MNNVDVAMPPEEVLDPTVEITLSMDPLDQIENIRGAVHLWREWAEEDHRVGVDYDAFTMELIDAVRAGALCMVVAYGTTGRPAGMLMVHFGYDSGLGLPRGTVERLFVTPSYRGRGVFRALIAATEVLGWLSGVREQIVTAPVGSPLGDFYRRWGFEPTDIILKRYR